MIERSKKNLDRKTLEIIFYFIERLNGVLGKTHLQKMLFLTDLLSSKKFKEKLTTLDYKKYSHGPYANVMDDYTSYLVNKKAIEARELPFRDESGRTYIRYFNKKPGSSIKKSLLERLGPEKLVLLDDVISSYGNMSLQDVLDVVYSMEMVKGAKKNTPLDIAKETESLSDEPDDSDVDF